MDELKPPDDLARFMASYTETWNSGSGPHRPCVRDPCFVVKGGWVLRHGDHAAKRSYFEDPLAGNQQQGAHT